MILDLEIGGGRDDLLALFDGRPGLMKVVEITFGDDSNSRMLTFEGGDASCLQIRKNGKWKCIVLVGNFPDSLGEMVGSR